MEYRTQRPIRQYRGPRFRFRHARSVSTLMSRYEAAKRSSRKPVNVVCDWFSVVLCGAVINSHTARERRQLKYPRI